MNQRTKAICHIVAQFAFSHVGLFTIVCLYCVIGGYIFEYLEKKNEEQICYDSKKEYDSMEVVVMDKIQSISQITGETDLLVLQLREILHVYRSNSINIGYTGDNCSLYGDPEGPKYKWTFSGALFFCVTVITTIGYGHIAPKTIWGRWVCLAYAMLGIPLFLICLATIGHALSDVCRYLYSKICCFGWCKRKKRHANTDLIPKEKVEVIRTGTAWSNERNVIGDNVIIIRPKIMHDDGKMKNHNIISSVQSRDMQSVRNRCNTERSLERDESVSRLIQEASDEDYDELDDHMSNDDDINIPVTFVMMILTSYLLAGALLFGGWETWDVMQSFYFCFITLSTIGFGDVLPGTDFDSPAATAQLILGAIYMVVGLSLVSMCFSLMQDEIIEKAKWIGEKLGIVSSDEDE